MRTNYEKLQKALNDVILDDVKNLLKMVKGGSVDNQQVFSVNVPLCHVIISYGDDYDPKDVSVVKVELLEDNSINVHDKGGNVFNSETDNFIELSDFGYMIDVVTECLGQKVLEEEEWKE